MPHPPCIIRRASPACFAVLLCAIYASQCAAKPFGKVIDFDKLEKDWNDEEEDDDWHEDTYEWKEKMKEKRTPSIDLSDPSALQGMSQDQVMGATKSKTQMLFATIVEPDGWTKDDTEKLSGQFRDLLMTNALEAKTYTIDTHQILFVVDNGDQAVEVKNFALR